MLYPELHFTGQVWRPPLRGQFPAPATDLRLHMAQVQILQPLPRNALPNVASFRGGGRPEVIRQWQPRARRVYLTGANPFALSYNKLMDVALLLRKYLPYMVSFGMFARVTDITPKTVEELKNLHHLKLDSINIGIETAHDRHWSG